MKNLKNYGILLWVFLLPFTTFGQQKVAELITNAKRNGLAFENQRVFSELKTKKETLLKEGVFRSMKNVSILEYHASPKALQSKQLSFTVPINGIAKTLDLVEVSDKFYSYTIVTNKKENYRANRNRAKHYRGVIRGEEQQSLVAISFFNGDVRGFISNKEGTYTLGKLKDQAGIILYNEKDLLQINEFECGVIDEDFKVYEPNILDGSAISADAYGTNCVRFYFETEFDMFQSLGSVVNVENYVTALYNQVAILYYNEGIDTVISEINVWTSADPYTSTNTAGLLTQFQSNTSSINGDLGHLLTFRNIGGGRAAGFNGLCNANVDLSLAVSGNLSSTITNVPTYSWEVMVVTHEFGHLFGSRHTHACVWNGNNTAIDGCGSCQEHPNPNIITCNNCVRPPAPAAGGTIMSYCHVNAVGINFSNGFGPQPGNVLRSNVANASCLTDCDNCVASGANFDLYMKDQPSDTGVEPNSNGVTWMSEDIWVRQNLDGGTTPQNAEFKTFTPNGVYIRVRNRGSQTSDCATLKVYWTKASAGLLWPTNFINFFQNVGGTPVLHGDIVGTAQIPAIAPGGSTIIELPWYPPNPSNYASDIHHFCLAARIISADDPMANEVNGRIEPNAQNNNNIVQKNISIQDTDPNNLPTGLFFSGVTKESQFINVLFRDKGFRDDKIELPFFERGGTIEVTIDKEYFEKMLANGSLEGNGIKILEDTKVLIYSNEAVFRKVPLAFGERFLLQFKFNLEKIDDREEVIFDVLQQSAEKETIQGGERFSIVKSLKNTEKRITDVKVTSLKEQLQVVPNPNDGSFAIRLAKAAKGTYRIYDVSGTLVFEGVLKTQETKLNLPKLPRGIYFVNVHIGNKTLKQSFIKK